MSTELLAPAPAPAANKPAADLLFTLSAANATFLAADRLELSSVQATAQAFNTETRATGIYSLGALSIDHKPLLPYNGAAQSACTRLAVSRIGRMKVFLWCVASAALVQHALELGMGVQSI